MNDWDDDGPIEVGDVLPGFCGGAFGHFYGYKRVEGVGEDWVVARVVDDLDDVMGEVVFYDGDPTRLREYR